MNNFIQGIICMKSKTHIIFSLISLLSMPLAFADAPQTMPGQMLKVLDSLHAKGFNIVKKIEFNQENGAFEANVLNAEGKTINIQINPITGEMTKPKGEIIGLTAIEIAKKLQTAGYSNIYEINTELFANKYVVKVLDENGKKQDLKVDVKTGEITKSSD